MADESPSLFTSKDIGHFLAGGEGKKFFAVTGLVEQTDSARRLFTLRDPFGRNRYYCYQVNIPSTGQVVIVEGFAHVDPTREMGIVARRISHIGNAPVDPPTSLDLSDLDERKHNLATIRTSGTLIEVSDDEIDPNYCFILLRGQGAVLPVACPKSIKAELLRQIDAEVQITGTFHRTVSGLRKFSGPFIDLASSDAFSVITPAPADIFSAPALEKRLYLTPREVTRLGRRTIRGRILAVWENRNLMIREADGRISHAQLAEGETAPRTGTTGIVVGYPETDLFRIILTRARFKPDDAVDIPNEKPTRTSVEAMFKANWHTSDDALYHGQLIQIRGIVRSIPSPYDKTKRMLLFCGAHQALVDISANPSIADLVPLEGEIEVAGHCLLETDSWHADNAFPRIKGLVIIPRTPSDVRVITAPPWWTPGRLLVVIGILFAATLGLIARNRIQKRIARLKMADRTRLAVELHDSISQNLTGASLQIDAVSELIDTDRAKALNRLDIASKTLVSCHQELRNCIWDLRNNALDEKDMATAIRKTVEQHIGDAELFVRFSVPRERLSDNSLHATLRIIRELATNAARHGEATTIRIAGAIEEDRLLFSVTDDGVGFDPDNRPGIAQGHFGLQGVEERVAELGGEMSVESEIGKGTRVAIWIRSRC